MTHIDSIQSTEVKYISQKEVHSLLDAIKVENNISEKLDLIAEIIIKEDIKWTQGTFDRLISIFRFISNQPLHSDPKLTFELLAQKIDGNPKFQEFSKKNLLTILSKVKNHVQGTLSSPISYISQRGFYGGRA